MKLFADSSWVDIGMFVGLLVCTNMLLIWGLCWAFHFFVGLKARPARRAILTVGLAYVLAVAAFEWFVLELPMPEENEGLVVGLMVPLAGLPGAALAYRHLYVNYARMWVDDPSQLPDGVGLANDDWRTGLMFVLGAIVTAIVVGLIKKGPLVVALHNQG